MNPRQFTRNSNGADPWVLQGVRQVFSKRPAAFIMSSNDKRRHMTKSQRAMIAAKVFSLNEKRFLGNARDREKRDV